jgi:hypothetical protein
MDDGEKKMWAKLSLAVGIAALLVTIVISAYPEDGRAANLSFWLLIALSISLSMHIFSVPLSPRKRLPSSAVPLDLVGALDTLVDRLKSEITPPTLALLAVAEYLSYSWQHGQRVKELNADWEFNEGNWEKRANSLEKESLLTRSNDEVARSDLGLVYLFWALKDPHYNEVLSRLTHSGWRILRGTAQ